MADTEHSIAPPNYRKADLNPMTPLLADKGIVDGPAPVNRVSGNPDFGTIAVATQRVFQFDFTSYNDTEIGRLVPLFVVYAGDAGAFVLNSTRVSADGDGVVANYPIPTTSLWMVCAPGSNDGRYLELVITATDADDGVLKTGTLTFYDRWSVDTTAQRVVLVVTLSKTYSSL